MNHNLAISLERADELLAELLGEYEQSLDRRTVSDRAVHLTHEICSLLRGVLDRIARRYWEKHVAAGLSEKDRKAAAVYFPIADNQNAFDSILGRWRTDVRSKHPELYAYLMDQQPFSNERWLSILADIAVQGKHIDLIPQTKIKERRVTVTGPTGSVSWGPGVTFGPGVSVQGAPIDPATQRIAPTPGVTEKVEVWVSFVISGHNVNAAHFCEEALKQVRRIVTEMSERFGL